MAINAFVALCTSLSSFLQNMRYSTICSFYNGHFPAILHKTKIYKIQKNTKRSTICSFYNRHFQTILQNTKNTSIPQFAASTTNTSKQFYKIQKKYKYSTICSFCNGHFQAILHCGHSHNSNLLGSCFLWTSLGLFTFFIPSIFSDHVFCGHCSLATFPEHVC